MYSADDAIAIGTVRLENGGQIVHYGARAPLELFVCRSLVLYPFPRRFVPLSPLIELFPKIGVIILVSEYVDLGLDVYSPWSEMFEVSAYLTEQLGEVD